MAVIQTQGLSEDYRVATGSYDVMDCGDLSKGQIWEIVKNVAVLSTPEGEDDCPPSINVSFQQDGYYSCFFGDSGVIRCLDSQYEEMTPDEAARIISGEMTLVEFDTLKGCPPKKNFWVVLFVVVFCVLFVAGLFLAL